MLLLIRLWKLLRFLILLVSVVAHIAYARRVQHRYDAHIQRSSESTSISEVENITSMGASVDERPGTRETTWAVASHFQPDHAISLENLPDARRNSRVSRAVSPLDVIRNMAFLCFHLSLNIVNAEFQLAVKGSYEWKASLSDSDYKGAAVTISGAAIVHLAPVSLHLIVQGEFKITSKQARSHNDMLKLAVGSLIESRLLGSGPTLDNHVDAVLERLAHADSSYNAQRAKEGKLDQRFTFSMRKRVNILQQSLALQLQARTALFLEGFRKSEEQQQKILELLKTSSEHDLQEWWMNMNPHEMHDDFSAAAQVFDMGLGGPIILPTPETVAPRAGELLRKIGETLIRTRREEFYSLSREVALLVTRTLFKPSGQLALDNFNCDDLAESVTVPLRTCPSNKPNCYKELLNQGNFRDSIDRRFKVLHTDNSVISRARLTCVLAEGLHGLPQRGITPQDVNELRQFWASSGNSIPSAILMVLPDFFFSIRQFIEFAEGLHLIGNPETPIARLGLQELISYLQLQRESINTFISEIFGNEGSNFVSQNMDGLSQAVGHIRSAAIIRNFLQKSLDAVHLQELPDSQPFRFDWVFTGQFTFQANFLNTSWENWSVCTGAPVGWDWSHFQSGWMPSISESMVVRCHRANVCKAEPEKKASTSAFYLMLALTWPGIDQKIGYKLFRIGNSQSSISSDVVERESVVVHDFQILFGKLTGEDSTFKDQLLTIGQALIAPLLEAVKSFGNVLSESDSPADIEEVSLTKRVTNSFHPAAIVAAAYAASSSLVSVGDMGSFVGLDLTVRVSGNASAGTSKRTITAVLWLASVISAGVTKLGKLSALATGIGWGAQASLANAMELDLSGVVLKGAYLE